MSSFLRGVRLGVDVGSVRIGLAISDPDGVLATPLRTLARAATARETGVESADISAIKQIVSDLSVIEVVVGLPLSLNGKEGAAATLARRYADRVATAIDNIPVYLTDERMSTVAATRTLSGRGIHGKRQRAVVDQAAAVEILQGWLDARRRQT
jgi:putative Holliday junction resolvase